MDFQDKVAVITGAGNGLGRELALACAARGMRLVLADLKAEALRETAAALGSSPHLTVVTDVSDEAAVDNLALKAYERFGAVHLLFNNAGVAVTGPVWTASPGEWRWALGVNLMGVIHGLRAFVPRMLEAGEPGHIINTASAAALLPTVASGVYAATKHAVLAVSETLHHELQLNQAPIGVSVVCPSYFRSGFTETEKLRPDDAARNPHPLTQVSEQITRQVIETAALGAADVARLTLEAVARGEFYVFSHPEVKAAFVQRVQNLMQGDMPYNPLQAEQATSRSGGAPQSA